MSREILFRGKREDNGEWVYGFYSRVTNNWEQKNVHFITCFKDLANGETVLTGQEIVDPASVGQYTGLTDKNSKKIFEGDIFKFDDEVWESYYTSCGTEYDSFKVENYGKENSNG